MNHLLLIFVVFTMSNIIIDEENTVDHLPDFND